jgi:LuxR family transcriptional regulator, quorum-sensing system regulator LasR
MFEGAEPADEDHAFLGERLLEHRSLDSVHTELHRLTQRLGFKNFLYGTRVPSPDGTPVDHIITNHESAWRERYQSRRYELVDPTLAHCLSRVTPLQWSQAGAAGATQGEFMEEARGFGLHAGVSIPVRGHDGAVGMLSLSLDSGSLDAVRFIRELVPQVQTLACYAHEAVHNLPLNAPVHSTGPAVKLSPRELECLRWVAQGKSNWETSRILSVTEHAVSFHLRNLMRKLEVSSRHVAVRRAVEMGLLRI